MSRYKTTTTFQKIATLKKPIRVIQGGKGSSKTISILLLFTLLAMSRRRGLILSIVGRSMPDLKSGALRDFENILIDYNVFHLLKIDKTYRTYEFPNGNIIEFFSTENAHSRLGSRRTHLYVNELDSMTLDVFVELSGRTASFTIVDYNPRAKFWIHSEYVGQDNVDFIKVNYLDNEYIPEGEYNQLMWTKEKAYYNPHLEDYDTDENTKSRYWRNQWRVLGLGELGVVEGVIFENWTSTRTVPKEANYIGAGLDFGFTNDPTAMVKLYRYDGKIYVEEKLYTTRLSTDNIGKAIREDQEIYNGLTIADNAEPRTINQLKDDHRIRIKGVNQRNKLKLFGIDKMQELEFVLVGDNLVKEFSHYSWTKLRDGTFINEPKGGDDHLIDAVRYAVVELLGKPRYSSLSVIG